MRNGAHPVIMELRFPDISLTNRDQWHCSWTTMPWLRSELTRLGATKNFDVFTGLATTADRDTYIRNHWRNIFYATFEITWGLQAL